jgi:hypothetical protein
MPTSQLVSWLPDPRQVVSGLGDSGGGRLYIPIA